MVHKLLCEQKKTKKGGKRKKLKAKTKAVIPILLIILVGTVGSTIISASALIPSSPQYVHLRYVTFGDAYQGRPHSLIRAIYRDAFYYADSYWQDNFRIPESVWRFSGSEDYWHFQNIYEFDDFLEGRLTHPQYGRWENCGGFVLLCETEWHHDYGGGSYLVQWGASYGTIDAYNWRMFVFLKTYRPSGIVNLPRSYVTQVIKREMMMGAGHGTCWIAWLFGGCLFEGYGGWVPWGRDTIPCPLCMGAIGDIGDYRGW